MALEHLSSNPDDETPHGTAHHKKQLGSQPESANERDDGCRGKSAENSSQVFGLTARSQFTTVRMRDPE